MSPSGIQINKTFIIVIAGVFAGVVIVYRFWNKPSETDHKPSENSMAATNSGVWYKDEFVDVPAELAGQGEDLVKEERVDVTLDGKTLKLFTRQAKSKESQSKLDVLFLHGMKFSSSNWQRINTLTFVAKCGYRAVAIDLPGFGNSKDVTIDSSAKGSFISAVVTALNLNRPVIVSPSMSGGFSLPYLFDSPETAGERSQGYVPVAPVSTGTYLDAYKKSQIPTMIVYGEKDKQLGAESLKNLKNLPNSKSFEIPNAGHAAYLDDTKYFHQLLYNFLKIIAS